jgi:hypothetical protein
VSAIPDLMEVLQAHGRAFNEFAKVYVAESVGITEADRRDFDEDGGLKWSSVLKTLNNLQSGYLYAPILLVLGVVVGICGVVWQLYRGDPVTPLVAFALSAAALMLPLIPTLNYDSRVTGFKRRLLLAGMAVLAFGAYYEGRRQLEDLRRFGKHAPGELYWSLGTPIGLALMLVPLAFVAIRGTRGWTRRIAVPAWLSLSIGLGATALIAGRPTPAASAALCALACFEACHRRPSTRLRSHPTERSPHSRSTVIQ